MERRAFIKSAAYAGISAASAASFGQTLRLALHQPGQAAHVS